MRCGYRGRRHSLLVVNVTVFGMSQAQSARRCRPAARPPKGTALVAMPSRGKGPGSTVFRLRPCHGRRARRATAMPQFMCPSCNGCLQTCTSGTSGKEKVYLRPLADVIN
jgi:hypothetical protein